MILLELIGRLREVIASRPDLVSPAGVFVYGIGTVLVVIAIARLLQWKRRRSTDTVELADLLDDETLEDGRTERSAFDSLAERHRSVIAPAAVEWDTRTARVGDQWTTTLSIAEYPDHPSDGYLSGLFERTDVEFDLTAHITPKLPGRARDQLQETADELQADADIDDSVRGAYLQERANETAATYKAVESGQRVFSQSLFVTVRADSKDELRDAVTRVRSTLREPPARLEPATAICLQDKALQSTAPIGGDELGRGAIALGGAVGALLASPHNPTILESGGVEYGIHKDTQSPLVVDPFAREDGYAMFTVGDPGSGKSFGAKQNFIRSIEQDSDRIGIILEPLNNWNGVSEALGGTQITVGGTLGLNPLEIKPTPEHVLQARGDDASPLKERRERAISFFTNFFAAHGVKLGDRRTTLETAFDEAYAQRGITEAVSRYGRRRRSVRACTQSLRRARVRHRVTDGTGSGSPRRDIEQSSKRQSDSDVSRSATR